MPYIFGYGSLMQVRSIQDVEYTIQGPGIVEGYLRSWNARIDKHGTMVTAIGVIPDPTTQCNGLVLQVSPEALPYFDERECAYERREIRSGQYRLLNGATFLDEPGYIYETRQPMPPTREYPIVMSYSDVVISGAIDVSEVFTQEFYQTTENWNYLHNDRACPIYVRALKDLDWSAIDQSMRRHLPPGVIYI